MLSIYSFKTAGIGNPPTQHHELRYRSLFHDGRGFSFPCDETGSVDLDALSETARINYLFARAMVGRDLATPEVVRVASAPLFAPARALHILDVS